MIDAYAAALEKRANDLWGRLQNAERHAALTEAECDRYRDALERIVAYDAFQGGPIAPRENPTTSALRQIAREALA